MRKNQSGNYFIFGLVLINLLLWLIFPPPNDGRPHFANQVAAEIMSTSALILMSCSIFLATRPTFLEPFFNGLDKIYKTHKTIAILVILLLFGHFFVNAVLNQGFHLAPSLGKIALIGLLISVTLALAPRLPFIGGYINLAYHQWRFVHRFVGLFFLIGILHSLRVQNVMQLSPPINIYVRVISYTGAGLYLYKELLQPFIKRGHSYLVERVRRLNGTVVEISMAPRSGKLTHRPGQFLFVRFPKEKRLREPHPFTISSAPGEERVRLTIKASGDFTQELYDALADGAEVRLEGGYGMFEYKSGGKNQVWVAGGIGLTPFLSWMRDFDGDSGHSIDFYYTTRSADEALFLDEIEQAQQKNPSFRAKVMHSNRDGHLSAAKIVEHSGSVAGKEIYLCGPFPMIMALRAQFMRMGVPARSIHYEEFSFR
jgi:predicted ferric reductase